MSGSRLSSQERAQIEVLFGQGLNYAQIAGVLGRARQTIAREVGAHHSFSGGRLRPGEGARHPHGRRRGHRGGWGGAYRWVYSHERAQKHADHKASRARIGRLVGRDPRAQGRPVITTALWDTVREKLLEKFSPRQVQAWLREVFPDQPELWVSHETIYQAIYLQARGAMREQIAEQALLRTGRLSRRTTARGGALKGGKSWTTGLNISTRPAEAEDRAVPGHWEGDLIVGARCASAIITLVERSTRFVMLGALPGGRSSEEVIPVLIQLMRRVPQQLRRSLAWDQGAELARHADFDLAKDCKIYFCDPHSPWQRGANENTNGLLRQYFPRSSTDFRTYTQDQLDDVARELNIRPRQTLQWDNPTRRLNQLLGATTP